MKLKLIKVIGIVLLSLCIGGCTHDIYDNTPSGDTNGNQTENPGEELTTVRVILDQASLSTYASTIDQEPTTAEKQINTDLELFIFNASGLFETHKTLTLIQQTGTTHLSDTFKLKSGNWYFYAFVNLPAGLVLNPTGATTRVDFEKTIVDVPLANMFSYTGGCTMGTLVGEKTRVTGVGDANNIEHITLKIGRMIAKVGVDNSELEIKGDLQGTFNFSNLYGAAYSINHEPLKHYLVGQWDGPFRTLGSQVISPHYYSYIYEQDFEPLPYDNGGSDNHDYPSIGMHIDYYTRENTNQVPLTKTSTTFLVCYKYQPAASELHSLDGQPGAATDSYGNFWMAVFSDGTRLLYNADPTGVDHLIYGIPEEVKEYVQGLTYYRIPIADYTEETPSLRYAVIRNHFYKLKVLSLSQLGNDTFTEVPDPEKPLEVPNGIEFTISVSPWEPQVMDIVLQ